jgi:phosphoribosylformimino-5-aminoimidazole carboxamide ribotide isomerase
MILFPAIDLKDGKCVRLVRGAMDSATVFDLEPAQQAHAFVAAGCEWLHLVDLNGAVEGKPVNAGAVHDILCAAPVPAQLGGGIRDMKTIATWLEAGVQRVILGTVALREPELVRQACKDFPGRIAVGIDARGGFVAVQGWTETSQVKALDLAHHLHTPVIASGGVSSMDDLRELHQYERDGIIGVICGRALYDGRIDPAKAVALLR